MSDEKKRFKRYMVWESEQYYPGGGLQDFEHSFDTLEEAIAYIKNCKKEMYSPWRGIFDRIEGVEVDLNPTEAEK